MKWMTIDYIKQHSRIDYDCEDSLLELYAQAAEASVLNITQRTYEELLDEEGHMPAPIVQATLMLVDVSYQHRSPVSPQNMYLVSYSFDFLLKPYMKL